jgi:transaldolase/glucose-6-phosphate isomerase
MPILLGALARWTRLPTPTFAFIFLLSVICLVWMVIVVHRLTREAAPAVAEELDDGTAAVAVAPASGGAAASEARGRGRDSREGASRVRRVPSGDPGPLRRRPSSTILHAAERPGDGTMAKGKRQPGKRSAKGAAQRVASRGKARRPAPSRPAKARGAPGRGAKAGGRKAPAKAGAGKARVPGARTPPVPSRSPSAAGSRAGKAGARVAAPRRGAAAGRAAEVPAARPRPAAPPVGAQSLALPSRLAADVKTTVEEWAAGARMARLWKGDATLWTGKDEDRWVGWLRIIDQQRARREEFGRMASDVSLAGFTSVVVLGMGGSSLCPDVLARTWGHVPGFPRLLVMDSTLPAQVRALERQIDLRRTLFVVASKSGTTLEPAVLLSHFLDRAKGMLGADAGSRFVAITDPGSELEKVAQREGFRRVLHGLPSIGGRFSALSHFGMAPGAAMGVDVPRMLDRAALMAEACAADVPADRNPGLVLGAVMAAAARSGRDKLTLVAAPPIAALGAWLEQLVAESLGKHGLGVVPVAGEALGTPRSYGDDRLFVQIRLASAPSADQDKGVAALERAGFPVVRIDVASPDDLGQEFFRWEMATAVAGAVLGVNPFDQPDVEAAKVAARRVTAAYEQAGALPPESPALEGDGLRLFADPANAAALGAAAREQTPAGWLRAHLGRLGERDYFALNAFLEMSPEHDAVLRGVREAVRQGRKVATTLGYGPRFLHSTGQLHKGGPPSGVFLVLTADDAERLPIPGRRFDFGVLARAQARGDCDVLAERGRRILRVHLGSDVRAGLRALERALQRAI